MIICDKNKRVSTNANYIDINRYQRVLEVGYVLVPYRC